jgi:hypothetical protein
MSQSLSLSICPSLNVSDLNRHLREQILVRSPPYCLDSLLAPFVRMHGRSIRVVLNGLNVYIVESDIRHHVLQTAVSAFQRHQLRVPLAQPHQLRAPLAQPTPRPLSLHLPTLYETDESSSTSNQCTGKTCSICLELIYSDNLQCLPCAHIFHRHCVGRWLRQTPECPVCRFKLT